MVSIIDAQREVILSTLRHITRDDWKVLVVDPDSKRLIDNVVEQDEILNLNITNIEQITDRRPTNRDVEAIYLLTPQPWIVDCLMADFEKRKYRRAHLVWMSLLHPVLRDRIDQSKIAREQIALFRVLNAEFYPRESHMVTFRDPWSFPILFHPACNHLVRQHMEDVAQKIVGVCVALGEYPTIRYYRPREARHEASILCSHLARFVQDELDLYAKFHEDFPPPSTRPRGALYITDRSMDLFAPFLHEFTYQAMAHDLLPIKEDDKISYRTVINEGRPDQQDKDVEIAEKDKLWTDNRHRHMKDTIEKLMADFQRFIKDNPNFTKASEGGANSLNAIKDMMAGLPEFQNMKESYGLHLGMAQESMNRFQSWKLAELGSVEQILATGLDEDYKKPKGLADQVVRMLDEDDIQKTDRLRLLIMYILYRDGILRGDLEKLHAHARLIPQDRQTIDNLALLGARTDRKLKERRPPPLPLFTPKAPPTSPQDDYALSRYEPAVQLLLEAHANGTLDSQIFAYTKPPLLDGANELSQTSATSLRSAKPTWAKTRAANVGGENRQRVIVFMAGGATYSESRACYEVGRATGREVVLVTSHMLTPELFLRQVGDLSADKRRLNIPAEMVKPQAPAHLFEPDPQPKAAPPPQVQPVPQRAPAAVAVAAPPTQQMAGVNLNGRANGAGAQPVPQQQVANSSAKLTKEPPAEKKKKHHFGFGKKSKE
ncbi:syntaxin binding protein 1 [Friedmanniomyces endolithicus]|nr:syntaxin binding protein 1 [Friedmanniomyces endolithicus]KAK0786495.1 syntaxin binding protein 1 [Friedmanniomyces endolithicus]KAK0786979.1 syntaxin binding protein 1 [Friedmanniomyces endolithicus]KAK0799310.1 syntaxin binding protein 1 [Friedmanniomyces endolithicus]